LVTSDGEGLLAAETRPPRTRVLVVSDHRLLAEALGATLVWEPSIEIVGARAHPELGSTYVRELRPDVVVLHQERAVPAIGQVVTELRQTPPGPKVIVLMDVLDSEALLASIQAGAAGYLTSDGEVQELAASILRAQAGEVLFESGLLLELLTRSDTPTFPSAPRPMAQSLGLREREVLQALAEGASTRATAARLGISVHTVRTHLRNAMAKLDTHSKLEAVVRALKSGQIHLPG
jgi:DNA-binding NarL/FixJ family response regulator